MDGLILRLKILSYNKNRIEFTVNVTMKFFLIRKLLMSFVGVAIFLIVSCGNIESEKSYCERKAEEYFLLCLVDIKAAPSYYGFRDWATPQAQAYAQNYCILEYQRKKRCPDQKSYKPHRKD